MINKLIYLLQELKDNYSREKMDEVLNCLEDEVVPEDLYIGRDKFREAFNGQHLDFYKSLASQFVTDLNELPDFYFLIWEPQLGFFNENTKAIFFEQAKEIAGGTDATDYVNGLI